MDVSIIIVSYNVSNFLNLCLSSVRDAIRNIDAEVIIVDNNSSDGSADLVRTNFPEFSLIANKENVGFAKANNQAVQIAKGRYIHYLNPDTILEEAFYSKSLAFLDQHKNIGCLGPKILDADGKFAFDSKKSFPSFWVSVYKLAGLSKFFPKSTKWNKYYAAHVGQDEVAPVDILSGCCLLVRKEALDKISGGFDERYFMYCEDVDMCHSIQLAGYDNYYFPEVKIVHFKGESTKKMSVSYMKVFYNAHALFIEKYYPKTLGKIYNTALRLVLGLRNVWTVVKHVFSIFKLFIIDTLVLSASLYFFARYWHNEIVDFSTSFVDLAFLHTIPIYIAIWVASLFLNGAYDKPYSLFRAGRGMLIGSIVVLAIYGIMPLEFRFSRGVMIYNALINTILLIILRVVLNLFNVITLVPRGKYNYKGVIIADENYPQILRDFQNQKHSIDILGRIGVTTHDESSLGTVKDIRQLQDLFGIHEMVFDINAIAKSEMLTIMQSMDGLTHFKFVDVDKKYVVSSDTKKSYPNLYAIENVYNLGMPNYKRNKRLFDLGLAIIAIAFSPLLIWCVERKSAYFRNAFDVLLGKKTWVGYKKDLSISLPQTKAPIYSIVDGEYDHLSIQIKEKVAYQYALKYTVSDDLLILFRKLKKNLKK